MGERAKLLKSQKNHRDMGIKKRSTEVSRFKDGNYGGAEQDAMRVKAAASHPQNRAIGPGSVCT